MAELYDMREEEERVILVAVSTGDGDDTEESVDELAELVKTAGAVAADRIIQNRERVHPGTYLGKGKIEEVRERVLALQATGVVCDDELSPAQLRNLEDALQTKVMDRTMVILDIFASHAVTRNPGGAGPAALPGRQAGRPQEFSFTSGRRNRNERTRREEAGV